MYSVCTNQAYSGRNVTVQCYIINPIGDSFCFKVMDFFVGMSCGNIQALVHGVRGYQRMGLQLDSVTIARSRVVRCNINYSRCQRGCYCSVTLLG